MAPGLLTFQKEGLQSLFFFVGALGSGLALTPDEAFGWEQSGLRTADFRPGDSAPLRTGELRPTDIGGNITADLRLSGSLAEGGSVSPLWSGMAQGLSYCRSFVLVFNL